MRIRLSLTLRARLGGVLSQVPSSSALEGVGVPPLGQHHGQRAALGRQLGVALVFGAKWLQQSVEVVADSLQPHGLQHARLPWPSLSPRDFFQVHVHSVGDVDTGEGCYFLFQRIFLTSGSNPGLLHCGWIL